MAEIELSVLARQCLAEWIDTRAHLQEQAATWQARRNASGVTIEWRFTTEDARQVEVALPAYSTVNGY